ncbi:unnamed protein product [Caenorhabditis sp. 36 PRJEB53466]|nr:unnamed protein product [Caenorhabditis sp. 36 PRJEB53466]
MVVVCLNRSEKTIPITELVEKGQKALFETIPASFPECEGLPTDLDRFRLLYNGKTQSDKDLEKLTDDDVIRIVVVPEWKLKKPIDEARRRQIDTGLAAMAVPFSNPEERRLRGFNAEFSQPNFMAKLLATFPSLCFDVRFMAILSDWYVFRAYVIRNDFKDDEARNAFKYTNPHFYEVAKHVITSIAARYGLRISDRPEDAAAMRPGLGNFVSHNALQNALQAALGNALNNVQMPGQPRPAPAPANPFQIALGNALNNVLGAQAAAQAPAPLAAPEPGPAPAQQEPEPMEQGYEQQAATLRSFGFDNEELIQLALEQANGDVQSAMEFLIEMNN